jgi:carboxymethylenebutenolidase
MDQRVVTQDMINLFDEYIHSTTMQRRVFMQRLAKLAGGTAAAATIVPLLDCNYANAQMVKPDDPRIETQWITFKGASGDVKAYLAKPKGAAKVPAIVVTHENRGLNPHIQDVTRRLATEGFLAMGVDYMSQIGGTPATEDEAAKEFAKLDAAKTVQDGVAAVAFLKNHPNSTGKVGTVGFCWGGGMSNQLAVNSPDLAAAVVYYGIQPQPEEAKKVKAKMMIHYAGADERINQRMSEWEKALKDNKVEVQQFVYEGKQHAFNNDTSAARYDAEAAKLAWGRTLEFFKKNLS